MLATDENALECDLLETYGILDYRELPPDRVALFSVGLRENSRIIKKISACEYSIEIQLLAMIADGINWLVWSKTRDAEKGIGRPESMLNKLMKDESQKKFQVFKTPEEFLEKWNSL